MGKNHYLCNSSYRVMAEDDLLNYCICPHYKHKHNCCQGLMTLEIWQNILLTSPAYIGFVPMVLPAVQKHQEIGLQFCVRFLAKPKEPSSIRVSQPSPIALSYIAIVLHISIQNPTSDLQSRNCSTHLHISVPFAKVPNEMWSKFSQTHQTLLGTPWTVSSTQDRELRKIDSDHQIQQFHWP